MRQLPSFLALIFLALLIFLNSGCASPEKNGSTKHQDASKQSHLTESQAKKRFKQIKDVSYKLTFAIDENSADYAGTVVITFKALDIKSPLRIDFYDGTIARFEVNGVQAGHEYNGQYITLPEDVLNPGENKIFIEFKNKLRREGKGISRFEDPEDKNIYIHTQLEPYGANRVFPCFDQPDIKATFESEIQAPRTWTVVTSTREEKITEHEKYRIWKFPESAKFSTYIWSLHAGPFKIWEKKFRIPLRLMVRQSLAKYVDTEEWFEPTQKGFDFFESYFNYPYPYKKYDQLIIPELSSGAMENVAAVTFNERFVSRGERSLRDKRRLADVILHEMAHMWFGNLVTMKWWNDLWLNESFATYMASLAMVSNTKHKEAWRDFYGNKNGAYWADNMVTTHPIEAEVPDTIHAMANFDAITYGKGAAVLKQISFFLTPEKFQKGAQYYFRKHAEQNTRREDFMEALGTASDRNLKNWQKVWLQTAGVNKIEARFSCDNNKISKFELLQSANPDHPYLRPHRTILALMYNQDGLVSALKTEEVEISDERTEVKKLVGETCPLIAYPNFNDHAYMLVQLDPISLKNFKTNPNLIRPAFLRQMLWKSMWESVVEARMSVKDFASVLAENGLKIEKDDYILRDLLRTVYGYGQTSSSILFYLSRGPESDFKKIAQEIESLIWNRLQASPPGTEEQKIFLDAFVRSARTNYSYQRLLDLLKKKVALKDLPLDQDRRWEIIYTLAEANHPEAKYLIESEEKKDKSFFGAQGALASKVALPSWDEKKKWLDEFKKEKISLSTHQLWAAASSLFPWSQENFRERYAPNFFEDLTLINQTQESHIASLFTQLVPIDCGKSTDRIGPYLEKHSDKLQPQVIRNLKNYRQEYQRCQNVLRHLSL